MIDISQYKDEKELGKALLKEWQARWDYMAANHHRSWELDLAFWRGQQYVRLFVQGKSTGIEYVQKSRHRARVTIDKIGPKVTRRSGSLYQRNPAVLCPPATAEPDDIAAARSCTELNEFLWRERDIPQLNMKKAFSAVCFGTAFWRHYWDPKWGSDIALDLRRERELAIERGENPEALNELMASEGGDIISGQMGCPGEDVEYPQFVFLNFGATAEEKTWTDYFIAKMVPITWFEETFPKIKIAPSSEGGKYQFLSTVGGLGKRTGMPINERNKWALYLEYRMKGNKKFPEGQVILLGGENGTVLSRMKSEFPDGRLGLHAIYDKADPFSAYGISLPRQLRNPQVAYNQIMSEVMTYMEYIKGRQLTPSGSGIKGMLTNDPLDVIEYHAGILQGQKPLEIVAPPAPSPLLIEAGNLITQHIDEMTSDHVQGMAQQTPNVRSALHYDLMAEKDREGRWNLPEQNKNLEVAATRDRLYLGQQNWPLPVPITVLGEGNRSDVKMFFAANIKGSIDVRIKEGGETRTSQVLHEQKMSELFEQGVFGDPNPQSPEHAFAVADYARAVGIKSESHLYKMAVLAENQAREETEAILLRGEIPPVRPWHDHAMHIRTHYGDANQQRYAEVEEPQWEALEAHCQDHFAKMPESQRGQIQELMGAIQNLMKQLQTLQQERAIDEKARRIEDKEREEEEAMAGAGI